MVKNISPGNEWQACEREMLQRSPTHENAFCWIQKAAQKEHLEDPRGCRERRAAVARPDAPGSQGHRIELRKEARMSPDATGSDLFWQHLSAAKRTTASFIPATHLGTGSTDGVGPEAHRQRRGSLADGRPSVLSSHTQGRAAGFSRAAPEGKEQSPHTEAAVQK